MAIWSGIKAKLENEYLAESLRGRIQYFATTYRESHDREGRAAILCDGKEILRGAYYNKFAPLWEYKDIDDTALREGAFDQRSFYEAFAEFDNQSIDKSLQSDNLLVRIFAILDRRVGKRKILSMKDELSVQPAAFRMFYDIRAKAEKIY